MAQKIDGGLMKVRFSIGFKLITIITFIVLISLGSIIALASWLVRNDLRLMAEDKNFDANLRTAAAAETAFENINSNSLILIRTITAVGSRSVLASDAVEFFFERNPQIASIFFTTGASYEILLNYDFFDSRNMDSSLAGVYRDINNTAMQRAIAGETILLNAANIFSAPILALFIPWDGGGAGILFSPSDLNDSFGRGVNQSYLLNDAGDVLIHANFDLVRSNANLADKAYTRFIWDSPERSKQVSHDEDGVKYYGAFTKLNTAGAVVVTNIEYKKVFEGIDATTRRNIYLTISVLSISIILIWFFAKSISMPLKALAAAAQDIEGGKFDVELTPKGHDEIGVLTSSFQRMSNALSVFGRFTNREVAVRAMRGEIKPGGTPKKATIFFSDIRDFTRICEIITEKYAEEASDRIVKWLNEYFTQMIPCVERTNGVVDKFVGDAVMAHWGTVYTTGSTRKDAYNCIRAALMMRTALRRMNKGRTRSSPEKPRIRIGMGINTGSVTAGQLGSNMHMEYTVIGDPVNLASRLESLTKVFGADILITETTWNLIKKRFITVEMPSVRVKGKEQPVRVFAVINYAKNPKGPKSLPRLRRILGIKPPENLKIDTNSIEQKYILAGKK
ncbi:MAG: HAMP domain-containing protein [Treponema sp.]|jgi:adenylate cyclase|nr:HAMP domain-containing protein [Treponema sp.]